MYQPLWLQASQFNQLTSKSQDSSQVPWSLGKQNEECPEGAALGSLILFRAVGSGEVKVPVDACL